jgi:hypothetical protein
MTKTEKSSAGTAERGQRRVKTRIRLKLPAERYLPRLVLFHRRMWQVRQLQPEGYHLWEIMDGVAFQDTETALETALVNAGEVPVTEEEANATCNAEAFALLGKIEERERSEFERGFRAGKAAAND